MLFRTSEVRRVDDEGLAKKQGLKGTHGNREFADLTLLICNIRSRCFDNLVKHILSLFVWCHQERNVGEGGLSSRLRASSRWDEGQRNV